MPNRVRLKRLQAQAKLLELADSDMMNLSCPLVRQAAAHLCIAPTGCRQACCCLEAADAAALVVKYTRVRTPCCCGCVSCVDAIVRVTVTLIEHAMVVGPASMPHVVVVERPLVDLFVGLVHLEGFLNERTLSTVLPASASSALLLPDSVAPESSLSSAPSCLHISCRDIQCRDVLDAVSR